jgi:restriction endonuclease Mrr
MKNLDPDNHRRRIGTSPSDSLRHQLAEMRRPSAEEAVDLARQIEPERLGELIVDSLVAGADASNYKTTKQPEDTHSPDSLS